MNAHCTHRELSKKSKIIEIGSRRKKLQPPKVDDFSGKINQMVDRKYSYVQIQLNFNLFAASIVVSVALEI